MKRQQEMTALNCQHDQSCLCICLQLLFDLILHLQAYKGLTLEWGGLTNDAVYFQMQGCASQDGSLLPLVKTKAAGIRGALPYLHVSACLPHSQGIATRREWCCEG